MLKKETAIDALLVSYLFYKSLEMSFSSVLDLKETKNLPKLVKSSLVAPVADHLDGLSLTEAFDQALEEHPSIADDIRKEVGKMRTLYNENLRFYESLANKGKDLEALKKQIAESSKITSFAVYKDMLAVAGLRGKESEFVQKSLDINLQILSFAMTFAGCVKSLEANAAASLKKAALLIFLENKTPQEQEYYLKLFDHCVSFVAAAYGTYETLEDFSKLQAKFMKEICKKSLNLGYTALKNFYQSFDAFTGTHASLQTIVEHPMDFLKFGCQTGLSSIEDVKKAFTETFNKHAKKRSEMLETISREGTQKLQLIAPYKSQTFINTAAIASIGKVSGAPWYSRLISNADIYGKATIKGLESATTEITKKAAKLLGASTAITANTFMK